MEDSSVTMDTVKQSRENNTSSADLKNTSGISLFSESSKVRFSKLPTDGAKENTEIKKKVERTSRASVKVVNKHEYDAYTLFVGNLPSISFK